MIFMWFSSFIEQYHFCVDSLSFCVHSKKASFQEKRYGKILPFRSIFTSSWMVSKCRFTVNNSHLGNFPASFDRFCGVNCLKQNGHEISASYIFNPSEYVHQTLIQSSFSKTADSYNRNIYRCKGFITIITIRNLKFTFEKRCDANTW